MVHLAAKQSDQFSNDTTVSLASCLGVYLTVKCVCVRVCVCVCVRACVRACVRL